MIVRRAHPAALAAIVLLGAALRLFPIWFGLPYPHARPDEVTTIGHAVAILAGDPNPHFFHWPSLTFYLMAAVFWLAGKVHGPLSPAAYLLIARAIVALAGTATIVVLARLAARIAGGAAGLAAALFLAVAPLHVRDSHFALTDVLMTLLVTGSLALLLRALERRSIYDVAAAGLLGGLAVSTKYSAAAIAAAMAAVQAIWFHESQDRRSLVVFGVACAAGFLTATPYALLDMPTFAADLAYDRAHLAGGHAVAVGRGWIYHPAVTLPHGLGLGIFAAALAGLVPVVRHHRRPALVAGAFAAAFAALVGSGQAVFFRYVMPLLPLACFSAAVAVTRGGAWMAARTGAPRLPAVAAVAILVALPSVVNSLRLDLLLARTDTRVLAARWLAPQLRPESTLFDSGGDYTRLDFGALPFHDWRYDEATRSFGDPQGATPEWILVHDAPLREYTAPPPSLAALLAQRYELVHEVRGTGGGSAAGIYDRQDAFFLPIAGFRDVERPGPDVRIYRRR
ncbi:MAG TPA: glycosyltransferase family 39 protein [Vicinamibacterales bacterium]|nr:glycosyltransferase family 39 protein [Vicinamibacterales bacterium]